MHPMPNLHDSRSRYLASALALAASAVAALFASTAAYAALGAPYASIAADQTQMRASIKISTQAGYSVHALTLPSGTIVREYVAGNGVVFAVAWIGPSQPNLSALLGGYFTDFQNAAKSGRSGRNRLDVERSDLVIQSGGHMRAFFGRAYLVNAVPAGVSTNALR
jgi:hypothetical protein